jgi:DNA-binding MarR family transcriptional regulator
MSSVDITQTLSQMKYDDTRMSPTRPKRDLAADAWRRMARFTIGQVQAGDQFRLLREQGLTPGHLKALAVLDADEPKPMGAIADAMSVDASQVTWLVDRLEERGFVERRMLPTDRRVKTVALTPRGVEFRERLVEHLYEPPAALLALDVVTLESLLIALSRLPEAEGGIWNLPAPGR